MNRNDLELSYRKSALAGASPIGLVIALLDTLSGNLRRAAAAIRQNDIEKRCAELNHATLVLGQLESWLEPGSDEELARSLSSFYGYLRGRMMQASAQKSASLLEAQIEFVLQVRSAWQQRDASAPHYAATPTASLPATLAYTSMQERVAFSQSA